MQVHVFIKGKVTGVFFRAHTSREAERVGVTGWIRNVMDRPDIFGDEPGVEAVFQGKEKDVDHIITWLYAGSPMSEVQEVVAEPMEEKETFNTFEIRR